MNMTKTKHAEQLPFDVDLLRSAARKMHGAERRAFLAEVTLTYCEGNSRKAEQLFGWGRKTIETGLGERRTEIICLGAQSAFSGAKRWEDVHPEAATVLGELAESLAQQDPTFQSNLAYTRLTAKEALNQLGAEGFTKAQLPSPSTMAEILNRMGYRLRKVVRAKPQKKFRKPMPFS
jgi:hypothetical protein